MPLNLSDVVGYVENNIGDFHRRRADNLSKLKLFNVLERKNPYLFKAKNIGTAQDLVKSIVDAHLSSQEEAIFGEFLEGLAIFVCGKAFDGKKSSAEGIDLEFSHDGIIYIVSVKSGPNWGNSSQIKRMIDNFKKAQRILRTSNSKTNVMAINGCCYGYDSQPDKGDYQKLCGQAFWDFISGDNHLFVDIIEPLGHQAKERNHEFAEQYNQILNRFTREFLAEFCVDDKINWEQLVEFNSGKKDPKIKKSRGK